MQAIITWFTANPLVVGALAGFVVSLLDLVFALKPGWAANGLAHWVYLQAKKLTGSAPPPAA